MKRYRGGNGEIQIWIMNGILVQCDERRDLKEQRLQADKARSSTNIAQRSQEEEINQKIIGQRSGVMPRRKEWKQETANMSTTY